jgi:hypothetical protein
MTHYAIVDANGRDFIVFGRDTAHRTPIRERVRAMTSDRAKRAVADRTTIVTAVVEA